MKKFIICTLLSLISLLGFSQKIEKAGIIKKDKKGSIYAVEFPASVEKSKRPVSGHSFLETYLEISANDHFEKVAHKSKRGNFVHEHYDQYYGGVKVEGAGYNFHYKNGEMYFANGNYVRIGNLNPVPTISLAEAKSAFLKYKGIGAETVSDYITRLIIKEIADENGALTSVNLVYSIYLQSDHPDNNEIGYVDAHTGNVLMTEPKLTDLLGTFATRYSGTRQADTDPITGGHRLFDNTRGTTIHTRNLQNNTTNIANAVELTDNDNNWTAAEHAANNNNMGLDVHWELQEIYDYFDGVHQISSFDDAGEPINAYVRYGENTDNAFWDPTLNVLLFGQGFTDFSPLASIDVVGHEYGHGITDFQIGWGGTGNQGAFDEGMSDIWGAILENKIRPGNTWRIGEQITLNNPYLRNLENTNDPNAGAQMADTFEGSQYNNSSNIYNRSGVFSHWFYLLVNGGSGTNGVGNSYSVGGINMELAEDIIVEAVFNNFLDNTTSYPAIRTAMINAATSVADDCNSGNFLIAKAVTDAWYAVGVGAAYNGSETTISGTSTVCGTNSTFSLQNVPTGTTVSWDKSSNLTYVPPGQGTTNYTVKSASTTTSGSGWVEATITGACGSVTLPRKTVYVSSFPTQPIIRIPIEPGPLNCNYDALVWADSSPNDLNFDWEVVNNGTIVSENYDEIIVSIVCPPKPVPWWLTVRVRVNNGCGSLGYTTRLIDVTNSGNINPLSVYPNPANNEVTVNLTSLFANQKTGEAEVYLYNNRSEIVYYILTKEETVVIPTDNIMNGLYHLKAFYLDKTFERHIKIEH